VVGLKILKVICRLVSDQQEQFGQIFREELLPALAEEGIYLRASEEYSDAQKRFVQDFFREQVAPLLEVQPVAKLKETYFQNKALYLLFSAYGSSRYPEDLYSVNIPSERLSRFVNLPGFEYPHEFTFLDDIVRCQLDRYAGFPTHCHGAIKLSRDAELSVDEEYDQELVARIHETLEERDLGLPTRFLYDSSASAEVIQALRKHLGLKKDDLIPGARYHNFHDFFAFPNPTPKTFLKDEPMPPLPHPVLEYASALLPAVEAGDHILHFPYQQHRYVIELLEEAVADPSVTHLKITLYRMARRSALADALCRAARAGKAVVVLMEAKARFDEANNLYWGSQLERAGATVYYSYPGLKVHAKTLLIRRSGDRPDLAYFGTGNFNEKTARLYGDHALLTADPRLTAELAQVFDFLEKKTEAPRFSHLFVSPFTLRDRFTALVDAEIERARSGQEAYMILKMNSLEDKRMIAKLYEADRTGVRVQLIVRGICGLVPGLKGWSERIEAVSILDRFLEHARVFIFGNGGEECMYLGSADWMIRNLDRRVEVAFPIFDAEVQREIRHLIDLQLKDNQKARCHSPDFDNAYRRPREGEPPVRAQADTYSYLRSRLPAGQIVPETGS
jgi:polyphosphate kinase